jgi:hypothetical protein
MALIQKSAALRSMGGGHFSLSRRLHPSIERAFGVNLGMKTNSGGFD